jgi:hypothetical protein
VVKEGDDLMALRRDDAALRQDEGRIRQLPARNLISQKRDDVMARLIQTVTIQLERPRGDFAGKIGVEDGTVLLVDSNGNPIDRVRYGRKLTPGEDAKTVACVLTRRWLGGKSTSFARRIQYPIQNY